MAHSRPVQNIGERIRGRSLFSSQNPNSVAKGMESRHPKFSMVALL